MKKQFFTLIICLIQKYAYLCNVRTLVLAIRAESREGQD